MASDEMVDEVLCKPLREVTGVDISSMVNSSKANKSGITSSSSRADIIHMYDECEEAHICNFVNR
jgi:hypothetical protein